MQLVTNMFSTMDSNDLKSLKEYLDEGKSGIEKYTNAVEYSYSVTPQIFKEEKDGVRQGTSGSVFFFSGTWIIEQFQQYHGHL